MTSLGTSLNSFTTCCVAGSNMALFRLMVKVTAASRTVVRSFVEIGQLVGCSGSVGPSQVCRMWIWLLFALFSPCCFSISFSTPKIGDSFSISDVLSVGEDEAVGLGGSEGSLPAEEQGEVLELGDVLELILGRISKAFW